MMARHKLVLLLPQTSVSLAEAYSGHTAVLGILVSVKVEDPSTLITHLCPLLPLCYIKVGDHTWPEPILVCKVGHAVSPDKVFVVHRKLFQQLLQQLLFRVDNLQVLGEDDCKLQVVMVGWPSTAQLSMPLHPLVVTKSAMVAHLVSLNFDSFWGNELPPQNLNRHILIWQRMASPFMVPPLDELAEVRQVVQVLPYCAHHHSTLLTQVFQVLPSVTHLANHLPVDIVNVQVWKVTSLLVAGELVNTAKPSLDCAQVLTDRHTAVAGSLLQKELLESLDQFVALWHPLIGTALSHQSLHRVAVMVDFIRVWHPPHSNRLPCLVTGIINCYVSPSMCRYSTDWSGWNWLVVRVHEQFKINVITGGSPVLVDACRWCGRASRCILHCHGSRLGIALCCSLIVQMHPSELCIGDCDALSAVSHHLCHGVWMEAIVLGYCVDTFEGLMEGSLHIPLQTTVGLGDSRTRRLASGNSPSHFHGGRNAGHESAQKRAIDQSLIACSLVTGRAQRPGEVSTSGRASLLVISALLNFSLWTLPLLYIDSETCHWVNTHKSGSEANLFPGRARWASGRQSPNTGGRGCSVAPFSVKKSRPSTHLLISCSLGSLRRWRLKPTWTHLPHLWDMSTCKRQVSITFRWAATLQGRGPPRPPCYPRNVHVFPRACSLTPFPSLPLENKSHWGAFPSLVPVRATRPCLGPWTADLREWLWCHVVQYWRYCPCKPIHFWKIGTSLGKVWGHVQPRHLAYPKFCPYDQFPCCALEGHPWWQCSSQGGASFPWHIQCTGSICKGDIWTIPWT